MADKFQLKAIISAVDKLSPTLKGIQKNVKITKKALGDIRVAGNDLLSKFGLGGAALSGGVFAALRTIVGENSKFEKFESILATIEGSAESARRSIQWIDKFSNETPYDLDEVTEAYVQLRAYGIDPTNGSLRSVGDAAAGMGKNIMDVVGALSSAMVGNSESLKSFGITAKKAGDTIMYSWNENGKMMVAKAKANNRAQIEAVVTGIWNRRYGGAMEKLSSSWDGQLAMIKGYVLNFARWIGERGLFEKLKGNLQVVIDRFAAWEADGTLNRLADEIARNLGEVVDQVARWIEEIDWPAVWEGFKNGIAGIRDFINAIGGLKTVLIVIAGLMLAGPVASLIQIGVAITRLIPVIFSLGKAFLAMTMANPVLLAIVAVIGLVAYAVYKIYQQWDPLKGFWENLWNGIKAIVQDWWDFLMKILSFNPLNLVLKAWGGVFNFFSKLFDKVRGVQSAGADIDVQTSAQPGPGSGQLSPRVQAMNKTQLTGEMTVKFENAPAGMRVAPGKTNQGGMTFNPDVGYRPFVTPF